MAAIFATVLKESVSFPLLDNGDRDALSVTVALAGASCGMKRLLTHNLFLLLQYGRCLFSIQISLFHTPVHVVSDVVVRHVSWYPLHELIWLLLP